MILPNTILLGDVNAKGPWDPQAENSNKAGELLEEALQDASLTVMNNDKPTRTSRSAVATNSVIDIIAVSPQWVALTDAEVDDVPTSDHHVIVTTVQTERSRSATRKKRWAFHKANWETFQTNLDMLIRKFPKKMVSIEEENNRLVKTIRKAARQAIPKGRRSKEVAWWNEKQRGDTTRIWAQRAPMRH